jgi:hypothetical protein
MTLTVEKMEEMLKLVKSFEPRPAFPSLFGMPIYVDPYFPQDVTETVKRIPAHPIIQWLAKWLPIEPWVVITVKTYRDKPPYMFCDRMFMSVRQHHGLISAINIGDMS